jgi:hypothetical protein
LDVVPVLAAFVEVVRGIEDCDFVRAAAFTCIVHNNIQLKKRNTFVSGCEPWKMYGSIDCAPLISSVVYRVDAPRSCTGREFI